MRPPSAICTAQCGAQPRRRCYRPTPPAKRPHPPPVGRSPQLRFPIAYWGGPSPPRRRPRSARRPRPQFLRRKSSPPGVDGDRITPRQVDLAVGVPAGAIAGNGVPDAIGGGETSVRISPYHRGSPAVTRPAEPANRSRRRPVSGFRPCPGRPAPRPGSDRTVHRAYQAAGDLDHLRTGFRRATRVQNGQLRQLLDQPLGDTRAQRGRSRPAGSYRPASSSSTSGRPKASPNNAPVQGGYGAAAASVRQSSLAAVTGHNSNPRLPASTQPPHPGRTTRTPGIHSLSVPHELRVT